MSHAPLQLGKLTITIVERDGEVTYYFSGFVDEQFRHKDVPRITKSKIVFDLEGITHFNSCGIREWIYLVRDISQLGKLHYRKCSVAVIDQINMVPDTLGKGVIESFFAPYFCPCSGEVNRLIQVQNFASQVESGKAPAFNCDSCGQPLEFDALEESYFLFASPTVSKAG